MRKRFWIGAIVVGVLLLLVAAACFVFVNTRSPTPAAWPVYEGFRCWKCGGPASINPHVPEQWGCRSCGYSTYRLKEHFRTAKQNDFATIEEMTDAYHAAGLIATPEGHRGSPAETWTTSRH